MLTKEMIDKANASMKTIDVKGKNYVTVNERMKGFRSVCPAGSITTEIVEKDGDHILFRASVADEDGRVLGVGHAEENKGSSYINKTSYVENCETSAIGRALGAAGFGIDDSMGSADEIANAIMNQGERSVTQKAERVTQPKKSVTQKPKLATQVERKTFMGLCEKLDVNAEKVLRDAGWTSGKMTGDQYGKAMLILKEIEESQA